MYYAGVWGWRIKPWIETLVLEKYNARFLDATGTKTPTLQDDLLVLVDGKIQITPGNTRHLFGVLKERVTKIVEEIA